MSPLHPPSLPESGDAGLSPVSLRRAAWSVALSLGVMAVIGYYTFEPDAFRQLMDHVNGWLLALTVGTVVLRVFFGGWRLDVVSNGKLGMMGGIRGQLAWDFFSNVTPSTVGGGPFAAAYMAKDRGISLGDATAIILFTMLLDQFWFALSVPLILVCTFYFEVIPESLGAVGTWTFMLYFIGLLGWIFIFGYATFFRPDLLTRFMQRLFSLRWLRRFKKRVLCEMQQLQGRAEMLRTQPPSFYAKGFALTLGTWLNRYALVVCIIWSVYPALDKLTAFLRSIALTLGSLVLPTPGGAGGLEGLYALFMNPLMPDVLVAPTLLTWRVLGYYIFIALGAFLSTHYLHKTLRRGPRVPTPTGDGHATHTPVLPTSETVD